VAASQGGSSTTVEADPLSNAGTYTFNGSAGDRGAGELDRDDLLQRRLRRQPGRRHHRAPDHDRELSSRFLHGPRQAANRIPDLLQPAHEVDETNWGPLTVNNATPLASGALLRKTVTLYAHLGEPASPCSVTTVCLATAADRGVAARNECWPFYHEDGKPEPAISAQPGDFVIYVHKYSRLRWA